jgi:hypothetical protein
MGLAVTIQGHATLAVSLKVIHAFDYPVCNKEGVMCMT